MNRSKWVAIATGAISLILGVVYLLIVQFLDFRGEMVPAPVDLGWVSLFNVALLNLASPFFSSAFPFPLL